MYDLYSILYSLSTLPTITILKYGTAGLAAALGTSILAENLKTRIKLAFKIDEKAKEGKAILTHNALNSMKGKGDDGFTLSRNVSLTDKFSKQHACLFGPTSAGKTARIIKHNIERIKEASIICTDPSHDISEQIDKTLDGYKVYHLDLEHPEKSIGIDPISFCKNEFCVRSTMETIMLNGFKEGNEVSSDASKWVKISLSLVNVYAVYNYRTKKYNFTQMISNLLSKPLRQHQVRVVPQQRPGRRLPNGTFEYKTEFVKEPFIDENSIEYEILNSKDKDLIEEFKIFLNSATNPEMIGSIYTTLNTVFGIFKDKDIKTLCSRKALDITSFRHYKSILYLHIPERYADYYKPITSILIKQFLDALQDDSNGYNVFFILDELCNIGIIPSFDKILATVRRYNIGIMGCVQSINQFESVYGQKGAAIILENFNTICALPGLKETGSYFSNLLGQVKVTEEKNKQTIPHFEQAMSANDIRTMGQDKMLIISKNKPAVIDTMLPIYNYKA